MLKIVAKEITYDAAAVISDCIKTNATLQKLKLTQNTISDKSISLIMGAIHTNNTLQILDISSNEISNNGAESVSQCIKSNVTLKVIKMFNNKITSHGAIKIAETIQVNKTLKLLDITENNIILSKSHVTTLCDHLKQNDTLRVLGISWHNHHVPYFFTVGINNECYVDNTWPRFEWTYNTVHCSFEEFDHQQSFDLHSVPNSVNYALMKLKLFC